jgi:predicted HD phosphohydrolase
MSELIERAKFKEMTEGTQEDWMLIGAAALEARADLADRVLDHLRLLDSDYGGFPVDRLEHCLQTATLAEQDGMDEEYIVCALLHDIGDTLGSYNHADVAAVILQPFVSEKNHWMVKHHGILQGYYFFHYIGLDRNARDAYKDHEFYQHTVDFCFKYDQKAFDPDFESYTLEHFTPMVKRVFAAPRESLYMAAAAAPS